MELFLGNISGVSWPREREDRLNNAEDCSTAVPILRSLNHYCAGAPAENSNYREIAQARGQRVEKFELSRDSRGRRGGKFELPRNYAGAAAGVSNLRVAGG